MPDTIALIGLGKIAQTQHVPTIVASPDFRLVGAASLQGDLPGLPVHRSHTALLADPDLEAVAICTPPDARFTVACDALRAGKHVLLEKPPTTTVGALANLERLATAHNRVLFTAWHSQHNAAVDVARDFLSGRQVASLHITWQEDVTRYHAGQQWIWQAGGFGVFDTVSNGLSILTRILPVPLFVESAELFTPDNTETPIAATVRFSTGDNTGELTGHFDWRPSDGEKREISLTTADGHRLQLLSSGGRLLIDGAEIMNHPRTEYRLLYARFAELIRTATSDVDPVPLRLMADIFLIARHHAAAAFVEPVAVAHTRP